MTYDAFLEQMKKDLEIDFATELPDKYSGVKIGIRDVEKLQGESYRGISFKDGNSPVEGNMNMQMAYEAHEAGRLFADILHETEQAIMQQVDRMPQFDLGVMSDYQAMKPKLMTELIPQKGNEERLADVPHEKIEDLALIYRIDLGERNGGRMATVITDQMMEQFGITQEQLHQDAVENAAILHPASLRSMREVMASMMGIEPDPPMQAHANETEKRRGLTVAEQELFLDYMKNHETYAHWYPLFAVMIGTGLRVGELTGLRWCDIDLEEGIIDVNHTLVYYNHRNGEYKKGNYFGVNTPKTKAGRRQVPMLDFVKEAFLMEQANQQETGVKCNVTIDGYTDFIFVNRFGEAQHQGTINKAISRIVRDCNDAQFEESEAPEVLLPHFSCHNLRHTFTTRMVEAGVNVKVIQDTLGHRDISTTMNIYADVTKELRKSEFDGLDRFFKTNSRKANKQDSNDTGEADTD